MESPTSQETQETLDYQLGDKVKNVSLVDTPSGYMVEKPELPVMPDGIEDQPSQLVSYPQLKINHNEGGLWENTLTGEMFEEVELVILKIWNSRVNFPQPFNPDEPLPLCSAMSALSPNDPEEAVKKGFGVKGSTGRGPFCGAGSNLCIALKWEKKDGQRVAPTCSDVINMAVFNLQSSQISLLRFMRSGLKCGKGLWTHCRSIGIMHSVILSTKFVEKKFKYHEPIWRPGKHFEDYRIFSQMLLDIRPINFFELASVTPDTVASIDEDGVVSEEVI